MTNSTNGWKAGGVVAAAALALAGTVLLDSAPASAQALDDSGCYVAADGTLNCTTIEIHGTLRNIVMVSFTREPLGIRLLQLRQSFLQEILDSVKGEPF